MVACGEKERTGRYTDGIRVMALRGQASLSVIPAAYA